VIASLLLEGRDRGWGWLSVSPMDPHPQAPPLKGEGSPASRPE
jgi:hypothetical protein